MANTAARTILVVDDEDSRAG